MFSGAQVSLYPMSGNFDGIILDAVKALDPYRDRLRIETDDISTLLVGPPDILFAAMGRKRRKWRLEKTLRIDIQLHLHRSALLG